LTVHANRRPLFRLPVATFRDGLAQWLNGLDNLFGLGQIGLG
jgi:hypothetical protein